MKNTQRPLRIAFGRFMQETNSFSPVPSTLSDFRHFIEGEELLNACQPGQWEIEGYLRNLELTGFLKAVKRHQIHRSIEVVPLFSAFAIPGGPLLKDDFELVCARLSHLLREAGELDAVFFSLHGALDVAGVENAEAKLLAVIREVLGTELRVAITLDLHATLTQELVSACDLICGYRTNPHRDFQRCGFKAGDLLIRSLLGEIKPTIAWRSLPMMLGGGAGIDFLPPMLPIFLRMNIMEANFGALCCNVYMCHPFIKHPEIGWSVYVITNDNQELAEKMADELAERCWNVKHISPPNLLGIEEVLKRARRSFFARKLGTITICDASDVVAAGSTGENTDVLRELLHKGQGLLSYVPLRDPHVVNLLWQEEIGKEVNLEVGGKLHPEVNQPLPVSGILLIKKDTREFGRVVVLDLNHVKLVVTEGSALALKPEFYTNLGLNAWKPDITVVKSFFHFRIYYLFVSRKTYYVKTSGITDIDIMLNIKTRQPVYPKDEVADWRETDALRRHVPKAAQKVYFSMKRKKGKVRKLQS